MSDYETTIRAIMQIPFVKDLRKENKSLRKEIKALKNLIYSLPEFRCRCEPVSHVQRHVDHNVKIKTEPGLEPTPCDTLADGDVVFVEKSRETENIVYVIDDHEVDVEVTRIHTEIQRPSDIVVVKAQAGAQAGEEEAGEEEDEEAGAQASEEEEEEASAQASEEEEEEAGAQAGEEEEEAGAQAGEEEEEEEAGEEEEEEEVEEAEIADKEPEEEEGEVYEITIAGKTYYTTNGQNGKIYAVDADEEVGDEIGVFVNGKATFYKKK